MHDLSFSPRRREIHIANAYLSSFCISSIKANERTIDLKIGYKKESFIKEEISQ
jgi:hypothetical protein